MKDLLKLTRPTNLLIIAATMALMRYGVIGGHLERGLRQLLEEGTQAALVGQMQTRERLYELVHYAGYSAFDERVFNFETPS